MHTTADTTALVMKRPESSTTITRRTFLGTALIGLPALSWPYVPLWSHVLFTALLLPMTITGGKLKATT